MIFCDFAVFSLVFSFFWYFLDFLEFSGIFDFSEFCFLDFAWFGFDVVQRCECFGVDIRQIFFVVWTLSLLWVWILIVGLLGLWGGWLLLVGYDCWCFDFVVLVIVDFVG